MDPAPQAKTTRDQRCCALHGEKEIALAQQRILCCSKFRRSLHKQRINFLIKFVSAEKNENLFGKIFFYFTEQIDFIIINGINDYNSKV